MNSKKRIWSVKQITAYIRGMFTQDYLLENVSVRGEISNLKDHPSGHIYFTLKDDGSVLNGIMFAGKRGAGLKCRLREGMQVVVSGQVNIYEASGRYQIYANEITEEGEGDLHAKFLQLKQRLEEMGMFDPAYKKPIPKYAKTVGIVTASSGAALHDIMQISARRNPYVQLILSPAAVQGESAPESIIRAIERLDAYHPDVMIVGRGGGSFEDLNCFNDEGVARAIFDCDTPVISAVGHEVDFTIADFAADLRAPTPSAAAELAVFSLNELEAQLETYMERMEILTENRIEVLRNRLETYSLKLKVSHPAAKLKDTAMRLADLELRLNKAADSAVQNRRHTLAILSARLNGRSPLDRLTGGFGYISTESGPLSSVKYIHAGEQVRIKLHDGDITARAEEIHGKT